MGTAPLFILAANKGEYRGCPRISRNKDAQLLGYAYEQVRGELLRDPSPGQLSRVKGRELMARMDMIKEGERFIVAVKYRDFRQVTVKDKAGLDYTKSIREVEPRSALEVIIRHFTDSPDPEARAPTGRAIGAAADSNGRSKVD